MRSKNNKPNDIKRNLNFLLKIIGKTKIIGKILSATDKEKNTAAENFLLLTIHSKNAEIKNNKSRFICPIPSVNLNGKEITVPNTINANNFTFNGFMRYKQVIDRRKANTENNVQIFEAIGKEKYNRGYIKSNVAGG